jgi:hopanoid biosynthesis associated protein HpnK
VRRLIINADDFGLTRGVNRAIVEAHEDGVVTSSTLMANGAAFDDAIAQAKAAPRLSIGCHAVLVDGSPVLGEARVSSLIDRKSANGGRFYDGFGRLALLAVSNRLVDEQIEAEVAAQIRKLQSAGISVSHIDAHKHTHLLPQVLQPLLCAAQACSVKAIRNPFGRMAFSFIAQRPALWKRYGQVKLLHAFAGRFQRAVQSAGMVTPDGSLGVVSTGTLDQQVWNFILGNIPEGTWELVCHPGYYDADLERVQTRLRASRVRELELLRSAATRDLLARQGVELISYRDLAGLA